MSALNVSASVALRLVELVAKALQQFRITFDVGAASMRVEYRSPESLDNRIAKLDATKTMLEDALQAVDELRDSAAASKDEVSRALQRLAELQKEKKSLEEEAQSMRSLIDADVTALRKVAGVPSPTQIRRERLLGFVTGVLASVVASGVVWLITVAVGAIINRP
ncbi:MAG: BREX-1 system adenine-specific DNA-methyltransferase PglX [Verrucomicrobiota bacterium]|nr:BREX-1 system adenine-specific DNA-methyltransferase PglX [Verrucomicrobiota bacterium]